MLGKKSLIHIYCLVVDVPTKNIHDEHCTCLLPMTNCLALISPLKAVKSKCLGSHTPTTYHWYRKVFPQSLTTMCASTAIFTSIWSLVTSQTSLLHVSLGVKLETWRFLSATIFNGFSMATICHSKTDDNQQASPNMAGNQPRLRKQAYWDASIFSSKAQRAAFVEENQGYPWESIPFISNNSTHSVKIHLKNDPCCHAYASSSSLLIDCTEFTRIRPWTFEPFFKPEG